MLPVHVHDIAGVSTNLIAAAREQGEHWELWRVPPGRGANPVAPMAARALDLARWLRVRRRYDIWHIHYGVTGYYGWWRGARPVVLHLHGTDVRSDLRSDWLGPVVRRSILTADRVLYSTPDLSGPIKSLRPDADWFPAPAPQAALAAEARPLPSARQRVVFASRWDDSKGGRRLIDVAANLRGERPDLELVGVDWGTYRQEAAAAGVHLVGHATPAKFRQLLASSNVVVGQLRLGIMSVADMEAMLMGRPLVGHFDQTWVDAAHYASTPPITEASTTDGVVEAVLDALTDPPDPGGIATSARAWVNAYHNPDHLAKRANQLYRELTR